MPIKTTLWKVDQLPKMLAETSLDTEKMLEDMIVAEPCILSDDWMLIGRQEDTGFGGRIDLLAIAPDGSLVLIELKRDRTPRDVVAQALDYASWLERLRPEDIVTIYGRFQHGKNLADDFQRRFGHPLDEAAINQTHQIVIVASSLDNSTERIVGYLSDRDIPINVLHFQIFSYGIEKFLSRSWLLDPMETQISSSNIQNHKDEPWNGEFYCSYGHSETRSWEDAVEFGFICGGGGVWYSQTLKLLSPGDRVWTNVPGNGYVGVGCVTGYAQQASSFQILTAGGDVSIFDIAKRGHYHHHFIDDPERCEYFVPVKWLQTVPIENAIHEIGLFGNQNTVCRPTALKWRSTVERLKIHFPKFDDLAI